VVLWGGVLTQVAWTIWKFLTMSSAAGDGKIATRPRGWFALNIILCSATGVVGMSQFLFQKLGEPMMGEVRYISFAVLMASAIFFSTAVGVMLGEWKGVSRRTLLALGGGLLVLLAAFAVISFAPAM